MKGDGDRMMKFWFLFLGLTTGRRRFGCGFGVGRHKLTNKMAGVQFFPKNSRMLLLMAEILHQLIGSLSNYLQGFIHHRWCRISSINSMGSTYNFTNVYFTNANLLAVGDCPPPRCWSGLKNHEVRVGFFC